MTPAVRTARREALRIARSSSSVFCSCKISAAEASVFAKQRRRYMALSGNLYERLSLGEVYGRTFSVYCAAFGTFSASAAAAVLPMMAIGLWIGRLVHRLIHDMMSGDVVDPTGYYTKIMALISIFVLLFGPLWVLANGACSRAVAELYTHDLPSASLCLKKSVDRLVGLLGSLLCVAGILILVMFVVMFLVLLVVSISSLLPNPVNHVGTFFGIIIYLAYYGFVFVFQVRMGLVVPAVMIGKFI